MKGAMKKRGADKRRASAGESIVEVTVSMLIFLLAMAMLLGSVRFAVRAHKESMRIRSETARAVEKLWSRDSDSGEISYVAPSTDLARTVRVTCKEWDKSENKLAASYKGRVPYNPEFSFSIEFQKKTVEYNDAGDEMDFYLYAPGP